MNDMSLKAKIRNIASEKNVSAQSVLQNYLMQRCLSRLSQSEYTDKFVIKGGMLISSIVGIDQRSTMDLDSCIRNLPLTEETISKAFLEICKINMDDGISFIPGSIEPIRDDDEYGGYRVSYTAEYGKIKAPMSMDISTGDVITPGAEKHRFFDMMDEAVSFELWAYPVETVLAEKIETILSRGTDNTRPRDFYDVYMLSSLNYDPKVLKDAFTATASHRGSIDKILDYAGIIDGISNDAVMNARWNNYAKLMPYASEISFNETIDALRNLRFY